jgi:hypothetical protein
MNPPPEPPPPKIPAVPPQQSPEQRTTGFFEHWLGEAGSIGAATVGATVTSGLTEFGVNPKVSGAAGLAVTKAVTPYFTNAGKALGQYIDAPGIEPGMYEQLNDWEHGVETNPTDLFPELDY